jgi:hypothetical protein
MRWVGNVAHMGQARKVYMVMVRKPEGKRSFGRPRYRREDGIRMDIGEIGLRGKVWSAFRSRKSNDICKMKNCVI